MTIGLEIPIIVGYRRPSPPSSLEVGSRMMKGAGDPVVAVERGWSPVRPYELDHPLRPSQWIAATKLGVKQYKSKTRISRLSR